MKLCVNRWAITAIVAATVFAAGGAAKAGERDAAASPGLSQGLSEGPSYALHLYHLHTHESLDVVYRIGDTYLPAALDRLNHFLRDHRTQTERAFDPREFDLLHSLMAKLGRPDGVIDIVCGYRTPQSNRFLRTRSARSGVAEHSQHMLAKAIDIRVPGVSTARLRDAALSLGEGGVGYYPTSRFVHVDVGPVREWSFGARKTRRVAKRVPRRGARTSIGE
jgi:uncharacterized protein YcbK (DUF882 family)